MRCDSRSRICDVDGVFVGNDLRVEHYNLYRQVNIVKLHCRPLDVRGDILNNRLIVCIVTHCLLIFSLHSRHCIVDAFNA
jgi:hypothetical protein